MASHWSVTNKMSEWLLQQCVAFKLINIETTLENLFSSSLRSSERIRHFLLWIRRKDARRDISNLERCMIFMICLTLYRLFQSYSHIVKSYVTQKIYCYVNDVTQKLHCYVNE